MQSQLQQLRMDPLIVAGHAAINTKEDHGKTTLLDSIWDTLQLQQSLAHLEQVESWGQVSEDTPSVVFTPRDRMNEDFWLSGSTDAHGLMRFMHLQDRKPLWLCVDEVQRTYGDQALWKALFEVARQTKTFVITAGSFGSHTGSTSHSPPKMIPPAYRMTLFVEQRKSERLSLAFTEEHHQSYATLLKAPELGPYCNCIKAYASPASGEDWTPGWHPGVVTRMAKFFINQVQQLQQSRASQINENKLVEDFTSECLHNAKMNGKITVPTIDMYISPILVHNDTRIWDVTGRSPSVCFGSIPSQDLRNTPGISYPDASALNYNDLKDVLMEEKIAITPRSRFLDVVPGNKDYKPYALRQCHSAHDAQRMGWLLQVPPAEGATTIELVHPMQWHKHYTKYLLRQTTSLKDFQSIDDLLCHTISNFSSKVLKDYYANEKMVCEDVYDKELSRTIHDLVGPAFAQPQCCTDNGDGYINFKIDTKHWLIELLQEGHNADEHIQRFDPGNKYGRWLGWDWRVLDFCMVKKPTLLCTCPNFRTVKFDKQGPFMEATIQGGPGPTHRVKVVRATDCYIYSALVRRAQSLLISPVFRRNLRHKRRLPFWLWNLADGNYNTTTTLGVTLSQRRPQLSKEDVKMATTIQPAPEGPSPNPQTATAVPPPSATSTLAAVEVSDCKEFKMNKKQYKCHYSSSNASLASFNIPPDPKVGNVHKDLSSNIWWVYQQPAPDGPVPEGRVAPSIKGVKKRVFVKPKNTAKRRIDVEDNSTMLKIIHAQAQETDHKRKAQEAGIDSDEGEEDSSQRRHKVKGKKRSRKAISPSEEEDDEEQRQSRRKAKGENRSDEEDEEQQAIQAQERGTLQTMRRDESVQSRVQVIFIFGLSGILLMTYRMIQQQRDRRMILFLRRRWIREPRKADNLSPRWKAVLHLFKSQVIRHIDISNNALEALKFLTQDLAIVNRGCRNVKLLLLMLLEIRWEAIQGLYHAPKDCDGQTDFHSTWLYHSLPILTGYCLEQIMAHLEGEKIWVVWPPTEHNIRKARDFSLTAMVDFEQLKSGWPTRSLRGKWWLDITSEDKGVADATVVRKCFGGAGYGDRRISQHEGTTFHMWKNNWTSMDKEVWDVMLKDEPDSEMDKWYKATAKVVNKVQI
ncbi:hypothetical protein BT96DRAFT_946582 [Gymnopus androsaceus JB14]|uniref:Uncharacterized protein n=1 Tax=Gymnopus androsaceus JB14 TaxID=1447944 RepID=A0A6A4GVM4_9AGAR|nr:hypothetical protein BT96DRAFT_946582 [Gymnopus androsaceus JB14]